MSYPQKTNAAELALRASIQPIEIDYSEIRAAKKQKIVFGARKRKLHRRRLIKNAIVILRLYRTPGRVMRILNLIRQRRNAIAGGNNVYKVVSIANKHYWRINIPAWESPFFDTFLQSELHRL
jgi:ectoine hydroxylase-related dioxygenase (phytanoyl-CoA dioxygenase family)